MKLQRRRTALGVLLLEIMPEITLVEEILALKEGILPPLIRLEDLLRNEFSPLSNQTYIAEIMRLATVIMSQRFSESS